VNNFGRNRRPGRTKPKRTPPPPTIIRKGKTKSPNKVEESPPLTEFPDRIIIISDKNFAHIGDKLENCFSYLGTDNYFINANTHTMESEYVIDAFDCDHARALVIYYDPGNVKGKTNHFTSTVNAPADIPWCLFRGSSIYRVDNLKYEYGNPHIAKQRKKRPLYIKKVGPKINFGKMREMNAYFDSLTPLIMVGTEDLLAVNQNSVFLGQPQNFNEPFVEDKPCDTIGHISTPWGNANTKKGTNIIKKAFNEIKFMDTAIIGRKRIPHEKCLSFLDGIGISVCTMTTWDYGMGYVGLESISKSCLTMSKRSRFSTEIRSPIINVSTPAEVIKKARFYHRNRDEFDSKRRQQYEWASKHFKPEAVAERFKQILDTTIAHDLKTPAFKFRRVT